MQSVHYVELMVWGAIAIPAALILTGAIGGYVSAKVAQMVSPGITDSDVEAIARAWMRSFAVGGAVAAVFFGFGLAGALNWSYLRTGLLMTIGFAVVGFCGSAIGAKAMFRRMNLAVQRQPREYGGSVADGEPRNVKALPPHGGERFDRRG